MFPSDGNSKSRWSVTKTETVRSIKNRNNDGRPPKPSAERHNYKITVRFVTADYYSLKAKARSAGMTLSDYIRSSVACSSVRERLRPSHMRTVLQLVGMANNLNQIARRANSCGYADARTEYLRLAERIDGLINIIRDDC